MMMMMMMMMPTPITASCQLQVAGSGKKDTEVQHAFAPGNVPEAACAVAAGDGATMGTAED
eukprot:7490147-Karenia_brevis.AAC.1